MPAIRSLRLRAAASRLFLSLIIAAGCLGIAPRAAAQFKSWVLAKLPDTPEGLAADSKGNLYATLVHRGEVVMLKEDGSYEHIAWVPSQQESGQGEIFGLDFDKADNLYVAYTERSKRNFETEPYSEKNTPPSTPMGTPNTAACPSKINVPTMALAMPPPVSPTGFGNWVKKARFIELKPSFTK